MDSRLRLSRNAYAAVGWFFVAGILTQVFLIGLTFLGGRPSLVIHRGLGHGLALAPLLMVVLAYIGRLPRPMKPLTWLSLVIYVLLADIVMLTRVSAPIIAALHPVLAVLLFGVSGYLALRAWRLVREPAAPSALSHPTATAMGD